MRTIILTAVVSAVLGIGAGFWMTSSAYSTIAAASVATPSPGLSAVELMTNAKDLPQLEITADLM